MPQTGDVTHITDEAAANAPTIYFEIVPTIQTNNGIVRLLLARGVVMPIVGGTGTYTVVQPVGVLTCSISSAKALRDEIDKALLLASPGDPGRAN